MLSGLTAEARLFIQLIHPESSVSKLSLPEDINWNALSEIASNHALMPVFYRALTSFDSPQIPKDTLDHCRIEASKISGRNLILKRELISVLHLLQSHGFAAIPYKGPVLTERLYGNIGLRYFDDLDLLVHKEDIRKIKKLLLEHGYTPKPDLANLTPSQEEAFLRFHNTYDFISKAPIHQLEVHWEVVPRTFSLNLDYKKLWERCSNVVVENLTVPAFSNEDLMLLVCIAGAKKGWDRISRVYDAAQVLRLYRDMDFDFVMNQARYMGAQRILGVGLYLASEILNAPVPVEILSFALKDSHVKPLTDGILRQMFGPHQTLGMFRAEDQFQPIHYRIRERFADRARYCLKVLFTPSIQDWSTCQLPGFAYFI